MSWKTDPSYLCIVDAELFFLLETREQLDLKKAPAIYVDCNQALPLFFLKNYL